MPSRRAFVASLATIPLAGCYGISAGYGGPQPRGPVRGESGVDVEAEHHEELTVRYLESENEVRFVESVSGPCDPEYDPDEPADEDCTFTTMSAENWAAAKILGAVGRASVRHVEARLGVGARWGVVTGEELEAVENTRVDHGVAVRTRTLVDDRDGSVIERPNVGFERLVSTTPRTAHGSYRLVDVHGDTLERERDVPVYAGHEVVRVNPEDGHP